VPLHLAIFRFGIEVGPGVVELHKGTNLENKEIGYSLEQLTKILQEQSQACKVEINVVDGTFSFFFHSPQHGASCWGGPPWAILGQPTDSAINSNPRFDAEALFNKEGFVRIDGDQEGAVQFDAARKATGLVWRQFMLRAFDRAVSLKRATLYARFQTPMASLQQLPADVWPILEIVDWQNGIARDLQNVLYYSIHAASARQQTNDDLPEEESSPPIYRTGAPGKPTSMHLVEAEFRARCDRGEAKPTIGDEAEILAEWLRRTHPNAPPLTPKTVKNQLRAAHREWRDKARN
jgi:hypothetical protein